VELGKRIKRIEHLEMLATDKRLAIIRQVIHDAKAIKLSSWEESYVEAIGRARGVEVGHMRTFRILYQGSTQLGRALPFLAACPAFVYMSLTTEGLLGGERAVASFLAAVLTEIYLCASCPCPEILKSATARVSGRRFRGPLGVHVPSAGANHAAHQPRGVGAAVCQLQPRRGVPRAGGARAPAAPRAAATPAIGADAQCWRQWA
jgi:hypothetical protein